ncbi:hypothetical protein BDFG_07713 [Blastomyces dermatitidis ATCC 26199]|nr:hypothetical protein BDFG_07713 [Blastomyces dermatitidis ATCC 26199]
MATFTYDITSPGPADGSPLPQLHTVYTPDPRSDEAPQHLLPMPFSASGDLSKDAASEVVGRIDIQETQGYGTQGEPWKYSGSADDPIIIDEPMSPTNLPCGSDQFVAIPSLQQNIEKVPEGYNVYANMTLDDLQEHGGLELLVVYYYRNNERRRTRSRGLYPALLQGDGSTFPLLVS